MSARFLCLSIQKSLPTSLWYRDSDLNESPPGCCLVGQRLPQDLRLTLFGAGPESRVKIFSVVGGKFLIPGKSSPYFFPKEKSRVGWKSQSALKSWKVFDAVELWVRHRIPCFGKHL